MYGAKCEAPGEGFRSVPSSSPQTTPTDARTHIQIPYTECKHTSLSPASSTIALYAYRVGPGHSLLVSADLAVSSWRLGRVSSPRGESASRTYAIRTPRCVIEDSSRSRNGVVARSLERQVARPDISSLPWPSYKVHTLYLISADWLARRCPIHRQPATMDPLAPGSPLAPTSTVRPSFRRGHSCTQATSMGPRAKSVADPLWPAGVILSVSVPWLGIIYLPSDWSTQIEIRSPFLPGEAMDLPRIVSPIY